MKLTLVLPLVAVVAFLGACSKPETAPEPVRAVKVVTVGASNLQAGFEYAGEVRAKTEARLGFRVGGKIVKRQAEVGQRVKVGQILAQLDPQDFKLATDAANASVAAATTNRDLAAADFKRFQSLKDQNFISGAELERRETALKAAQAQLDQANAQLANTKNQVGYANLVATASGVVTAVEAEAGQVVAAGSPVVRIAQDGARDVVFNVPEDKLAAAALGTTAKIRALSAAGSNAGLQSGTVRELAASADPLTRTFQAKLTLPAGANLPLGSTVYVYPNNPQTGLQTIKLPTSSLMQSASGQSQVWLLDTVTMKVNAVSVQVAAADGNEAVISGGLKAGDVVVGSGIHVLSPGLKVSIFNEKSAAPAAKPTAAAPVAGNVKK